MNYLHLCEIEISLHRNPQCSYYVTGQHGGCGGGAGGVGGFGFERLPHFVDKDRRRDVKLLREAKKKTEGSSRFSAGVIIDADPSARHATLLLIRSHYNVSTLPLFSDR